MTVFWEIQNKFRAHFSWARAFWGDIDNVSFWFLWICRLFCSCLHIIMKGVRLNTWEKIIKRCNAVSWLYQEYTRNHGLQVWAGVRHSWSSVPILPILWYWLSDVTVSSLSFLICKWVYKYNPLHMLLLVMTKWQEKRKGGWRKKGGRRRDGVMKESRKHGEWKN